MEINQLAINLLEVIVGLKKEIDALVIANQNQTKMLQKAAKDLATVTKAEEERALVKAEKAAKALGVNWEELNAALAVKEGTNGKETAGDTEDTGNGTTAADS